MAYLKVQGASKSFGARNVLQDVNLFIEEGEFVSIVGTSGSGKTTLLKLAAGLVQANSGGAFLGGLPITDFPSNAAIVFQNYSLLPWFSALENVRLAVESAFPTWDRKRQESHSMKYLEMVGLHNAAQKRPGQLSGGMRQRVAIARAFAVEPRVLFLDEPFGALDALTRATLQQELAKLCQEQQPKATALLITNNVDEAILLSDRVMALGRGPAARLSPAVAIDLERPRTADMMMHSEAAVKVRGRISEFLLTADEGRVKRPAATKRFNVPAEVQS